MIPNEVMKQAEDFMAFYKDMWPEDDWMMCGDNWDLNLWLDENVRRATLYPVLESEEGIIVTDTLAPYPLEVPK